MSASNPVRLSRSICCLAAMVVLPAALHVKAQDPQDVDRQFVYIDRVSEATDFYNQGKYAESLATYRMLAQKYQDLDADRFVAIGIGDCLAALGQVDEARRAYEAIQPVGDQQRKTLNEKIADLAMKGRIDDGVLKRLRQQIQGEQAYTASWRLGRALQKYAADILAEASSVFRQTAKLPGEKLVSDEQLTAHSAYLDDLLADLRFLIDEMEGRLSFPQDPKALSDPRYGSARERHVKLTMELPSQKTVQLELDSDAATPCGTVKVDGRPLQLSPAQSRLLQRLMDRAAAVMIDAAHEQASASSESKETK